MNVLELKNVTKIYGERIAVNDLTLDIPEGTIFGLLGMNGAGKTTAIKMATGLASPTAGEINVCGLNMLTDTEQAKAFINISPQETAVAKKLTVKENLQFIARLYGYETDVATKKTNDIMQSFHIADRANTKAEKLSGGLCRRLSLAMAVITDPKLVFLDEPTLGLDIVARRELWKFVTKLKQNSTVVLTTHYLEEAEALCDQIAILADGNLVGLGTVEELKQQAGSTTFEDAFLKLSGFDSLED